MTCGEGAEEITSCSTPHKKKNKKKEKRWKEASKELKVCVCLNMLHSLAHNTAGSSAFADPAVPPVHSVSFTVVVVERSVSVAHVTICCFFLRLAVNAFALV